jgi:hypothetical protein
MLFTSNINHIFESLSKTYHIRYTTSGTGIIYLTGNTEYQKYFLKLFKSKRFPCNFDEWNIHWEL